ncbi:unnamed protein product [Anisakis simplex]|uniref:MNNL domain-containing protein n=1 Tax=Anisakis simplex TaxID=6269 RepID=A0A0M3KA54_ANISI|nr:unnamed protein product [Anisakis simplex]
MLRLKEQFLIAGCRITSSVSNGIDASGTFQFEFKAFEANGALNAGKCCPDGAYSDITSCTCEAYVHLCVGVRSNYQRNHRDCALIHHNSRSIIRESKMIGIYSISLPFNVRWPQKVTLIASS